MKMKKNLFFPCFLFFSWEWGGGSEATPRNHFFFFFFPSFSQDRDPLPSFSASSSSSSSSSWLVSPPALSLLGPDSMLRNLRERLLTSFFLLQANFQAKQSKAKEHTETVTLLGRSSFIKF